MRVWLEQQRLKLLAKGLGGSADQILDIGAAHLPNKYLPKSSTGLDINSPIFHYYDNFVIGDLQKSLPFESDHFRYVIAGETIEHLHNPIFCLRELFRILQGGN